MQLVSFQIKECFGFRDSGHIDLQDPTNLIYVLGRNSSGKTSFLTALEHFAPSLTPQDHPNFKNFNPSTGTPYLLGKYRVSVLSVNAFDKAFLTRMQELNQGSSAVLTSIEYKKLVEEQAKLLHTLYTDLLQRINHTGNMWVLRTASGKYQFSTEQVFKDYNDRRKQVSELLTQLPRLLSIQVQPNSQMYIGGNWQNFHQMSFEEIESLLALQLPMIASFRKAYSLLDVLPDIIKIEHLTQSPNHLTTALIEYLDKDRVKRLLQAENPRERHQLLSGLREKLTTLVDNVNRARALGTQLLTIDLDRVDGLQVTVITGDKWSFYRHLSDNTKLLFAYHLYKVVYNLRATILLFDEPNNGFHATAQELLLAFLRDLGTEGNLVIVSTHSEHLVDPDHLTGVRLMTADEEGYLSIRNKWYAATNGPGDFQALRPILDAIGLRYGANHLTIRDKVIVTEGVTELLYLRAFRQLLGYECELHIAPATGDKTIPHVVALLISQGLHFKVVADTTVGHKSTKDELQEGYDIPDKSIYEVAVPIGFPEAKGSGIEDVFSKTAFAKLLATTGNTPGDDFEALSNSQYMKKHRNVSKRVVAHEFNKHIADYSKDDFDEETLSNMRSILDFCTNAEWFLL